MGTDTREEILAATRRALCDYGFADLTTKRIAEEGSMTTGTIHYHFDTKAELLTAFLDDLMVQFEARLACEDEDPRQRLTTFLDAVFTPSTNTDSELPVALMEMKGQAPYHDSFRERFLELDEVMRTTIATAVTDGIDAGYFHDAADPQVVARLVVTTINGTHVRQVALDEDPARTREVIEHYLELHLGWSPDSEVLA